MSESPKSEVCNPIEKPKVRFCEQKKMYHYKKVTAPLEKVEVLKGFVSTKCVANQENSFDTLLNQLLKLVLNYPGKLSYPKEEILLHIKLSFSLDDEEWDAFIEQSKTINKHDIVLELEYKLNQIGNKNNFYNKLSFENNGLYSKWKRTRRRQIKKLLEEYKKNITDEITTNIQEEQNGYNNEENTSSSNLSRQFSHYINLFNIFVSYEMPNLSESYPSLYIKILERMNKEYLNSQITNLDLDVIYEIKNVIDESDHQLFSFLTPISQFLLNIYSEFYGITLFNNQIVMLNYLLSNFKLNSDFPIALIVYLFNFKSLLDENVLIYNNIEYGHIRSLFLKLRKEIAHYTNNLFRYFKATDIQSLSQILVLLKLTDHVISSFTKEDSNSNWNEILKEMVDQSIQNFYQDVMIESKDITDPHCEEASNVTTTRKKKRINIITHPQLLRTMESLQKKIKLFSNYDNVLSTAFYSKKKISFIYYQSMLKDVKHFMGTNEKRKFFGPIVELLVALSNFKNKLKLNGSTSSKIETLIIKFMKFWLSDANEYYLHKATVSIDEDNWKLETDQQPEDSSFYSTSCINNINTHDENLKYFKKLNGVIPENNYTSMLTSYIEVICNSLKKYSEILSSKIVEDYPNYLQLEIYDLICQDYGEALLETPFLTSKKNGKSKKLSMDSSEAQDTYQSEEKADSNIENRLKVSYNSLRTKKKDSFTITETMCIKINNIELTEQKYKELIVQTSSQNQSNIKKLLNSHIYIITNFLWNTLNRKISKLLGLSKKKLNRDEKLIENIVSYLLDQIDIMNKYLTPNLFKESLMKLCDLFSENFKYYIEQGTSFQIQLITDLIEIFRSELICYGVTLDQSSNFIVQNKIKKEGPSEKIDISTEE